MPFPFFALFLFYERFPFLTPSYLFALYSMLIAFGRCPLFSASLSYLLLLLVSFRLSILLSGCLGFRLIGSEGFGACAQRGPGVRAASSNGYVCFVRWIHLPCLMGLGAERYEEHGQIYWRDTHVEEQRMISRHTAWISLID